MIGERVLRKRLVEIGTTLGIEVAGETLASARASLAGGLSEPSLEHSYLLLAATSGTIPRPDEVIAFDRRWRLADAGAAIAEALAVARRAHRWHAPSSVRIESGVLIDVTETTRTPGTSGIQRVVRSTLARWIGEHDFTLVAWNGAATAPRTLRPAEAALVSQNATAPDASTTVIPFRATWILLEIAIEPRRLERSRSIASFSGSTTSAVGYDCIPMTSAETAVAGMPGAFAGYLATLARFTRVAPISGASRIEFAGFETMLSGAGLHGPELTTVALPASSGPGPASTELVSAAGVTGSAPLVLAVGSHEPRKNHLALLQAAELAWRDGLEFTLVIAGSNSWDSEEFDRAVAAARARGRALITLRGASDATLWALYRAARFTMFPSLNEGFGLPVVESISAGTPVITSDFGSMRESAEGFGGLLVNPHSDHDLASALRHLLTDDVALEALRAQTLLSPTRTWDRYAAELWDLFAPAVSQ